MKRIGIAASKMSKGNVPLYNLYVVLISCLFSLLIFLAAGTTIAMALILIGYLGTEIMGLEFKKSWSVVMIVCMTTLTVVVALFNIFGILINIRISPRGINNQEEQTK